MNAPNLTPETARQIMDLASAIERAESEIKQVLLTAARAGDCATVITIVNRWQTCPVTEVLVGLNIPGNPPPASLDP